MNKNMLVRFLIMAYLIALPCLAAAEGANNQIEPSQTDRSITNQIERSLDGLTGEFAVDTDNGVVTLIGTVRDAETMNIALDRARNISGVLSVVNELRVDNAAQHQAYRTTYRTRTVTTVQPVAVMDDNTIAEDVRYRLRPFRGVNSAVNNGTAILSGIVRSQDQRVRAARIAAAVDGVQHVKNDIRVENFGAD